MATKSCSYLEASDLTLLDRARYTILHSLRRAVHEDCCGNSTNKLKRRIATSTRKETAKKENGSSVNLHVQNKRKSNASHGSAGATSDKPDP